VIVLTRLTEGVVLIVLIAALAVIALRVSRRQQAHFVLQLRYPVAGGVFIR
jgi:hypothetical protein